MTVTRTIVIGDSTITISATGSFGEKLDNCNTTPDVINLWQRIAGAIAAVSHSHGLNRLNSRWRSNLPKQITANALERAGLSEGDILAIFKNKSKV